MKLNKETLNTLDLRLQYNNVDFKAKQYFLEDAGIEHYRLLAWLSINFNNSILCDIGTYLGSSALALSYNKTNKIISYDLVNANHNIKFENIEFKIKNCLDELDILLSSPLICLDTFHDGKFENEFLNILIQNKYTGLLFLDDIHLNDAMKQFWNSITIQKYDVSEYGHWSGSGIVCFNNQIFVEFVGS